MLPSPSSILLFDTFTVDLARTTVRRGEEVLALRRQSFDVLRYLAERPGEVVSRDDIVSGVWAVAPARPEDSLFQCIKDIRRALGDDARWIIRAVPGTGYQFMAEVRRFAPDAPSGPPPVSSPEPPAALPESSRRPSPEPSLAAADVRTELEVSPAAERATAHAPPHESARLLLVASLLMILAITAGWLAWRWAHPPPAAPLAMLATPTIAVLPFTASDKHPDTAAAARAFSDDIATEISRQVYAPMIALKSVPADQPAAANPGETGRKLGARYLLAGTIHGDGVNRVATIHVIESETGHRVWSQAFRYTAAERKQTVVQISGGLGVRLLSVESRRPLPLAAEAGHYAILAADILTNQRTASAAGKAMLLAEKAIAADANSVASWLVHAWAHIATVQGGRLRSEQRAAHLQKAHAALDHALERAPREPIAYYRRAQLLRAQGDPEGAIAASQRALVLNPNLALAHAELGVNKLELGLANETIAHIEEAIRLGSPLHNSLSLWQLWAGQAATHIGDYELAVLWLQRSQATRPAIAAATPWLAIAYAGLGRTEEARALIAEHLDQGHALSMSAWRQRHPRRSGVLAEQRTRIEMLLASLGVPDGSARDLATRG